MNQRRLGSSGIVVSEICMGTMTFGTQAGKETSFRIMDRAFDAGIDFFDNAELYPVPPSAELVGLTEDWLGEWMAGKPREAVNDSLDEYTESSRRRRREEQAPCACPVQARARSRQYE